MIPIDASLPVHIVVNEAFTASECADLRAHAATLTYELASVAFPSGARVATEVRNNARAIDTDPPLAARLFGRLRAHIPERVHGRSLVGLSPRLRYYRYQPGEQFRAHRDGREEGPDRTTSSLLTVLVYIGEPAEGGETRFVRDGTLVPAALGSVLLFQHGVLHEGLPVIAGEKLVLRTDALYRE